MSKKKRVFKRKFAFKAALIFSIAVLLFSLATSKVHAVVTVVSPSNMQSWAFDVQSPDGFGTFVTGPATPPSGVGSARLYSGTQGNLSIVFHNVSYANIKLSDITKLEYYTYVQPTTVTYPKLILNLNTVDGTDPLTFVPAFQSQTPAPGVWQSWNTMNGTWRSARSNFATEYPNQTLSDYVLFDPSASIINAGDGSGGLLFRMASSQQTDAFDGNIDNFTIGVFGGDITFDFEPDTPVPTPSPTPPPPPTNLDQCKNGGWNAFRNPVFKNQGDCTSFVNKLTKIKPN